MTRGTAFGRGGQWEGDPFSLEEIDGAADDGWLPISLRSLQRALRRRRRVWLAAGAMGLIVGTTLHVVVPSKYAAVTDLYLVEPSAQAISDDVALLSTSAVADRAQADLRTGSKSDALAFSYKGTPLSPSILQIKVSGSSPAAAVTASQALASAFQQERSSVLTQQTQAVVRKTQAQIAALNADAARLTSQINTLGSGLTGSDASHQADLVQQRNSDIAQITSLQNSVQQSLNSETSLSQGSRILSPPRYVPASRKKVVTEDALSGLVAGLVLGVGVVTVTELLSDRVRGRADIAAALGAPVELSVARTPRSSWLPGRRRRRQLTRPHSVTRIVERRLRHHLDSSRTSRLCVVELGALEQASQALAALAVSLSSEGKRVLLIDVAQGRPLQTLLGGPADKHRLGTVEVGGQRLSLFVVPDDPAGITSFTVPADPDVILTLASVDPAIGTDHLSPSVGDAVVIIRAGATSSVHIKTVGTLLRHSLIDVRSAILIGADADDLTSGRYSPRLADDSSNDSVEALRGARP